MTHRLLAFTILLITSDFIFGQTALKSDSLTNSENVKDPNGEHNFIIKVDPTRFFLIEGQTRNHSRSKINEFGLSLEQRITGTKSSIEFDFGATLYDYAYQPVSFKENDADDEYYFNLNYSVKSQVGFYSGLGYRYYTKSALRGLYFSPKFKYRILKDEIYPTVSPSYESRDESRNEFLFTFNIGFQSWSTKNITFDVYIGGGYKYQVANYYTCYWSYNQANNSSILNWIGGTKNLGSAMINLGLKVGFGK